MIVKEEILNRIICDVRKKANIIVGTDLKEAILYGSYVRGDFDDESDIDIALIIGCEETELSKYRKALVKVMSELSLKYETVVSITCIPSARYEEYRAVLPYYINIDNEGIPFKENFCHMYIGKGKRIVVGNELDSMRGVTDDELLERFKAAIRIDNEIKRIKGCPVSGYDRETKRTYLEYPDGRKEFMD